MSTNKETKKQRDARAKAQDRHTDNLNRFRELLANKGNPELSYEEQTAIYNKIDSMVGFVLTTEEAEELGWNS